MLPIPTPPTPLVGSVPKPKLSCGLKKNSLFCFNLDVVFTPVFMVNLLGILSKTTEAVWETPVVELTDLRTLSLDDNRSTLRTFICSVPTPTLNISFSLTSDKLPEILKKVTIPVAVTVPIPCVKTNLDELTPIL